MHVVMDLVSPGAQDVDDINSSLVMSSHCIPTLIHLAHPPSRLSRCYIFMTLDFYEHKIYVYDSFFTIVTRSINIYTHLTIVDVKYFKLMPSNILE